jgi:hypothetical protein
VTRRWRPHQRFAWQQAEIERQRRRIADLEAQLDAVRHEQCEEERELAADYEALLASIADTMPSPLGGVRMADVVLALHGRECRAAAVRTGTALYATELDLAGTISSALRHARDHGLVTASYPTARRGALWSLTSRGRQWAGS